MDPALAVIVAAGIASVAALGGALVGAKVGADAAREVARISQAESQADRDEARRARFAEEVRRLAAQILVAGQTHMDELNVQVNLRVDKTAKRDGGPTVGSTEPIKLWVAELELTAREPATVDGARTFYSTTVWLDRYVYIAQRDRRPDGTVTLLTEVEFEDFNQRLDRWRVARRGFVNAVRLELGATTFPDPGPN